MTIFHQLTEKVADYTLFIDYQEKQIKGHWDVKIYLEDQKGRRTATPCIQGLYSVGRRGTPTRGLFFQTELKSRVDFVDGHNRIFSTLDLIDTRLAENLYRSIGKVLRPGGQLFVSYNSEELFSVHTEKAFRLGIPPVATMLGKLVALTGCVKVWSHYGAEGRDRIEGEKPETKQGALRSTQEMLSILDAYMMSEPRFGKDAAIEIYCRENAKQLIDYLGETGDLQQNSRPSERPRFRQTNRSLLS